MVDFPFIKIEIKINSNMPDSFKVEKCQPTAIPYSKGWGLYKNYMFIHFGEDNKVRIVNPVHLDEGDKE